MNEQSGNSGQLPPDAGSGGDARHIATLRELLVNDFAEQDEGSPSFIVERSALAAAIRALSARQPVGETVVWINSQGGQITPQEHADLVASKWDVSDWRPLIYGDTAACVPGECVYAMNTGEQDEQGHELYVLTDKPIPLSDYELLYRPAPAHPAPAAVPVDGLRESQILAKDHDGMRVSYSGLLRQARGALTRGSADPALAEMLRQLEKHMEELGKRWYAGDRLVVDELLQLYCIETNARRALLATHPQPAAAGGDA
ncbi:MULTISPECIES: hypothetical protein [Xanthomonas]|uniref:hypothetical protein n=1 Tax=Xanthomonas TaxID=338 RepID=UPI000D69BE8A|nr:MULTISPECIES: hypothetical protein [Xanthomonas]PWH21668.1 hypothetical protein CDO09_20165 [Xanthomonas perforans]QXF03561.1 hypothetical protein KJA71_08935 [Xanthomonas citri pv. citri]QXO96813.1 hypothetical protein IG630_23985 [Xanthomonas sp. WG16]